MNNKGFSLVELLVVISLIAIVLIAIVKFSGNTLSLSENEAYKIMKNSVINASDKYILECESGILECSYKWQDDKTSFKASDLVSAGYFDKLLDPRDEKDLANCLVIEVTRAGNDYKYQVNDEKCK